MKYAIHILFSGLILTAVVALQSCETPREVPSVKPAEAEVEAETTTESLGYPNKTIAEGYLTGNEEEGIGEGGLVINSQSSWDALVTKMNSVNQTIDEQSIDFNEVTVLAFFDQIRGSGGYTVDIFSVVKEGNKLFAKVQRTAPKEDAIEIMTQPFEIVFIEKTDLPIIFVD